MKLYPNVTYIFIIWLIAVLVAGYLGFATLPGSGKFTNDNFWQSLKNWDGGHYTGIAQIGYDEKFQYAFFPLYPLAIKTVNGVTQNYLAAAILVSVASTFFGLQILYKLVMLDFDRKIAEKVILALLFFPTSFFFLIAYSEGLFFLLTVAAFYFLRQNKLFWATIAVALASATRLIGLAVVAGFLIDILTRQGLNRRNWFVLFSPLGFIIYIIFLYQQTGDPFYFITAENHWQRTLTTPVAGFWETLKTIASDGISETNISSFVDLIFAVFGVGFVIRAFRFLPTSFAVYSLISVAIPLFTPTLSSMPRFLLVVFPLFILVALVKNRYVVLFLQVVSLMLLAVFTALFTAGYWVS